MKNYIFLLGVLMIFMFGNSQPLYAVGPGKPLFEWTWQFSDETLTAAAASPITLSAYVTIVTTSPKDVYPLNLADFFADSAVSFTDSNQEYTFSPGINGNFSAQFPILPKKSGHFQDVNFIFGTLTPVNGAVVSSLIQGTGSINGLTDTISLSIEHPEAKPVPEPMTIALLLPALLGLIGIRQRKTT